MEVRQYMNQEKIVSAFKATNYLVLRNTKTYFYNEQGEISQTVSTGWVFPTETWYEYDELGREIRNIHFVNTVAENDAAASSILITTYEYYENTSLVSTVGVARGRQKKNGEVRSKLLKRRVKRVYRF